MKPIVERLKRHARNAKRTARTAKRYEVRLRAEGRHKAYRLAARLVEGLKP